MKIESIRISAFGRLSQVELGPFSDRVVVIHGPDESGKSALHAFIRAMLFGFPQTGLRSLKQVTPSGRYGGRLTLRDGDGRVFAIERYLEAHAGEARITTAEGDAADTTLDELLAHVSRELYQSVFAFGPEDLLSVGSMPDEAAGARMYAAGLGVENVPEVLERFEREAARIFDPAGSDEPVAQILRELAAIESALAVARTAADSYHELRRRRDETSLDIRDVDFQIAAIGRIERRVADAEHKAGFPPEGRPRGSGSAAATGADAAQADLYQLRRQIDELRESWTRLQAMRRMHDVYQATVARQRIPRSPWFLALLMVGAMLPVVIGAIAGHDVVLTLGIASAGLGMIMLVLAAIARSRFESAQLQALLHLEMTHREAQGRFHHAALATRIDPERVDAELERLEGLQAQLSAAREQTVRADDHTQRGRDRETQLSDVPELDALRAEWRSLATELGLPEAVAGSPAVARAAVEARRDELLIGRGRLDEQIQQLERDRRGAELRFERQELLTELGERVREWSTQVIAATLLRAAVDGYGRQRQPEILRAASDAFDAMTLGAYHRLVALVDGGGIAAIGRDGREVNVAGMSRGVREQAYLALRIGLIRSFGGRAQPLPVLVDDVLVNFDPERAVEALRALASLTPDHQLFLFTSHPATVALARFVTPGASFVALGKHQVSGFAPIWLDNN